MWVLKITLLAISAQHRLIVALESVQTPTSLLAASPNINNITHAPDSKPSISTDTRIYVDSPMPRDNSQQMIPHRFANIQVPLGPLQPLPAIRNATLDRRPRLTSEEGTCPPFNQSCGTHCYDINVEQCCLYSIPSADWPCKLTEDCVKDGCCDRGWTQCGRLGCIDPATMKCCEGEKLHCWADGDCNLLEQRCCGQGMKSCAKGCYDPNMHHCCVRKGGEEEPIEEMGVCVNTEECCGRGCCDKGTMTCEAQDNRWVCVPKDLGASSGVGSSAVTETTVTTEVPETGATTTEVSNTDAITESIDTSTMSATASTTDIQESSETPTTTASAKPTKVVNSGTPIHTLFRESGWKVVNFRIPTAYALGMVMMILVWIVDQ